jgi:hypothetical protein
VTHKTGGCADIGFLGIAETGEDNRAPAPSRGLEMVEANQVYEGRSGARARVLRVKDGAAWLRFDTLRGRTFKLPVWFFDHPSCGWKLVKDAGEGRGESI